MASDHLMVQLRFPNLPDLSCAMPLEPEAALLRALAVGHPREFPALVALLASPARELRQVRASLRRCFAEPAKLQLASTVCGLSLGELNELVGELSKKRLSSEQRRRRADYLTRLRNRDFGF